MPPVEPDEAPEPVPGRFTLKAAVELFLAPDLKPEVGDVVAFSGTGEVFRVTEEPDRHGRTYRKVWVSCIQCDLLPIPPYPAEYDEAAGMCPNCVTPWKCNGPHEPAK